MTYKPRKYENLDKHNLYKASDHTLCFFLGIIWNTIW